MRSGPEVRDGGFSPHSVRLAWVLVVAYLLVVVYASLQPFQGWRSPPDDVQRFLAAPWPRFITLQDVAVNIAAYAPLGLLLSIGFGARLGPARGVAAATLAAAVLSFAMETAQTFLPSRIASNVDLLANALGALLGAMAAPLLAPARRPGGALHAARHRLFLEGMTADAGLVVLALWLATQFHPTVQLFGAGSVRATFDLPARLMHTPALAFTGEAAVAALSVLGAGLLLSALMREGAPRARAFGALIGAALAIKFITAAVLVSAPAPLAWLTPGAMAGLATAAVLLAAAMRLPRRAQLAAAAGCIVAAVVAINVAPDNPYQSIPPRLLAGGASHFLNFSGIARALSELWPLLATGYLLHALAARRH